MRVSTQRDGRRAKWIAVARFAGSCAIAFIVCAVAWKMTPQSLTIKTPIVGYPIFADFNFTKYFRAFDLVAIVFPVVTFVCFALSGRFGPLRVSTQPRTIRPVVTIADPDIVVAEDGPLSFAQSLAALGRIALPALVLAIEVSASTSIATSAITSLGVLVGIAYVVGVAAIAGIALRAGFIARFTVPHPSTNAYLIALSFINAVAATAIIPAMTLVSGMTTVHVSTTNSTTHFPWFPAVVAWPTGVAIALLIARRLRRHSTSAAIRRLEGDVVALIVGLILLYLCLASLPSALGGFIGFDDAQYLAGAQLVFVHGLQPWRDVFLLHGVIEDAFDGIIGMGLFSHSRWGTSAGFGVVVYPIGYAIYYLFVAYFSRRNRLAIVIGSLVILTGQLPASILRFAYLPLLVMAFDYMLRRPSRRRTALFAGLVVLEAIFVPEIALMAVGFYGTLVMFEWFSREPGTPWLRSFERCLTVAVTSVIAVAPFLVYLVVTHSVSGFINYYRLNVGNHALWGAIPYAWSFFHDPRTTMYALLPLVLLLLTAARSVAKLRSRSTWTTADWSTVASATFVVLYYQKLLDRADPGHVVEVFIVCTPLVLLWALDALRAAERGVAVAGTWARASIQKWKPSLKTIPTWLTIGAPATVVALVVTASFLPEVGAIVRSVPGRMHASSPAPPPLPLLGYTVPGAVNTTEVNDLNTVLDAYAGTSGPVFDFSNEPGITYFLLNRVAGTAFFHIEAAETPSAQQLVIAQLEKSRPRVAIFTNQTFGLYVYDGITTQVRNYIVSAYLLSHYRPFVSVDGQILLLRDDLVGTARNPASLGVSGISTASLAFAGQACGFGDIPNFLETPARPAKPSTTLAEKSRAANTEIVGWAVDDRKLLPAKEILIVSHGEVIATGKTSIFRSDIVDYYKTSTVAMSGFSLDFLLPPGRRAQVYALNVDGTVSRIVPNGFSARWFSVAHVPAIKTPDSVSHPVVVGAHLSGWMNSSNTAPTRIVTLTVPRRTSLAAYQWMQVSSTGSLGAASYVVDDGTSEGTHDITWTMLSGAAKSVMVPVGSCLSWHGYSSTLRLVEIGKSGPLSVTLGS